MAYMEAAQMVGRSQGDLTKWWGSITDALPFYVLLVDEDHRIVAWNRAMQSEFASIVPAGAYCPEIVHGLSHPFEGCPLETAVHDGGVVEKELYDQASGHWVSSAVYPTQLLTDKQRRIYLHFTRDITKDKVAQIALAQSLEHSPASGTY